MEYSLPFQMAIMLQWKGSKLLNNLNVNDVLYIHDFKCNLLSDLRSRKLISMGRCKDGLYYMEKIDKGVIAKFVTINSKIWHRRLGHTSNSKFHQINSIGSVVSIDHCDSYV
uniref:GAG-pre-integrase domain-containing protein n=1 Tax=Lactuca sativa TaxID=4236 RepID=A0A9R1VXQ4_LACSA|nr:hypothetical protein LSAT_V11C400177400 [Lactuca sativa]